MIEILFLWTGAVVWTVIGLLMLWLVAEVLWGAVVAFSFVRFAWKSSIANGMKPYPAILKAPSIFMVRWWEFIGFRHGSKSFHGVRGEWHGVGKWTVFYPSTTPEKFHEPN